MLHEGSRVPLVDKVMVDAQGVTELVEKIRAALPQDIEQAKEIRERGKEIVSEAIAAAERIRVATERESRTRIEDHAVAQEAEARRDEIIDQATLQAQHIIEDAQKAAGERREEADNYSLQALEDLQQELAKVQGQVERGIEVFQTMGRATKAS